MENLTIGMKFHGHDSAVCIYSSIDKEIFAISTERLTRYKHDDLFCIPALEAYLKYKNMNALAVKKIDIAISFTSHEHQRYGYFLYEYNLARRRYFDARYIGEFKDRWNDFKALSTLQKLGKLLVSKRGLAVAVLYLANRIFQSDLGDITKRKVKGIFKNSDLRVSYHDHEYCHAASAFYMSNYENALVFTMDGFGDERVYSRVYLGNGNKLQELGYSYSDIEVLNYGDSTVSKLAGLCSIGGVYSYITNQLGFQEGADEGKTEALAAYGKWNNEFYHELISIASVEEGAIKIDVPKAEKILNGKKLKKYISESSREDIAAAIQKFTEEIVVKYVSFYVEKYGVKNICLSGGVHANVILNLKIYESISSNIFVVPAMADDGSAQGALLLKMIDDELDISPIRQNEMPYYGTSYSESEICQELEKHERVLEYQYLGQVWPEIAARRLVDGQIGAIFHGRMEFGPRALGNRSIIASAMDRSISTRMNLEIKKRPGFQPFCPSILLEEKDRLFDSAYNNKHMSTAFRLMEKWHNILPSATHLDGTARAQFVSSEDNPNFYQLLKSVKKMSGFGIVLNTSFNKHGRTIVESPKDAIDDFLDTDLEYMIIEGYLVTRVNK